MKVEFRALIAMRVSENLLNIRGALIRDHEVLGDKKCCAALMKRMVRSVGIDSNGNVQVPFL